MAKALAVLALMLVGCAQLALEDRRDEISHHLDNLVAKKTSQASILGGWGLPERRETIGDSEYWVYYYDHGTTHRAVDLGDGVVRGRSVHHYDKITLQFSRRVLVAWQADVN